MNAWKPIRGTVVPLPRNDVDTDMIIPAQFLTSTSRSGYGENVFRRLRDEDPDFPLNQARYAGAEVLVARKNFGCGSSREHAVWAITGAGFRVVIAESFADIFSANSSKNSLLLVTLNQAEVETLLERADGSFTLSVDLESQLVTDENEFSARFVIDPFLKHRLLEGLDDIDYIRSNQRQIDDYRAKHEQYRFYRTEDIV